MVLNFFISRNIVFLFRNKFEIWNHFPRKKKSILNMNFTITSLALSSYYSFSPLFIGNSYHISKLNFNLFATSIFYNNLNLHLEKSIFSRGTGSIITSEGHSKMLIKETNEQYHDMEFREDNKELIYDDKGKNWVIIIRDCRFIRISVTTDASLIRLINLPTVYLTSLTFDECKSSKSLIWLHSKYTTMTHICASNFDRTDENYIDGAFLISQTEANSFFKMVYSTISGKGNSLKGAGRILYFFGTCSLKTQCLNLSNFKLEQDDRKIIEYRPECLNLLMSTFANLDCYQILFINNGIQSNDFGFYIAMNNFINNKFSRATLTFEFGQVKKIYLADCGFTCQAYSGNNYLYSNNNDKRLIMVNCVFDGNNDLSHVWIDYSNCKNDRPTWNELAHYVVEGVCEGEVNQSAFGCNNDTCPDDK